MKTGWDAFNRKLGVLIFSLRDLASHVALAGGSGETPAAADSHPRLPPPPPAAARGRPWAKPSAPAAAGTALPPLLQAWRRGTLAGDGDSRAGAGGRGRAPERVDQCAGASGAEAWAAGSPRIRRRSAQGSSRSGSLRTAARSLGRRSPRPRLGAGGVGGCGGQRSVLEQAVAVTLVTAMPGLGASLRPDLDPSGAVARTAGALHGCGWGIGGGCCRRGRRVVVWCCGRR